MKNVRMTVKSLSCLAVIGALTLTSCGNEKAEDPKEIAEHQNEARFEQKKSEKDAAFLVEAASINLEEIELGELAQQKGISTDVKNLGKMMVKEHREVLIDLRKLAARKSITLPNSLTEDGQKAYDKLNDKKGKDFDKAYCDRMVKGHKKAIDLFEDATEDASDTEISDWAMSMLAPLRMHLDHANACQEKCDATK